MWRREQKVGCCNICRVVGPLTEDHVPPKRSRALGGRRELVTLSEYIAGERVKPRYFQSGLRFRTLCPKCNNERLGHRYDPELAKMSRETDGLLRAASRLYVPRQATVRVRPQRIARAVVGHLLAAEVREDMSRPPVDAPFPNILRAYFLDEAAPLPDTVDIRYWLYTGNADVIIRALGIARLGRSGLVVCDLLKYYPLAFMVIFETDRRVRIGLDALLPNRALRLDDYADLPLRLAPRPPITWPEQPDDEGIVLVNDAVAYTAFGRTAGRRDEPPEPGPQG